MRHLRSGKLLCLLPNNLAAEAAAQASHEALDSTSGFSCSALLFRAALQGLGGGRPQHTNHAPDQLIFPPYAATARSPRTQSLQLLAGGARLRRPEGRRLTPASVPPHRSLVCCEKNRGTTHHRRRRVHHIGGRVTWIPPAPV